jgi:hypothetical protein
VERAYNVKLDNQLGCWFFYDSFLRAVRLLPIYTSNILPVCVVLWHTSILPWYSKSHAQDILKTNY